MTFSVNYEFFELFATHRVHPWIASAVVLLYFTASKVGGAEE